MLKSIPFYSSLLDREITKDIKAVHSHLLVYGAMEVHSFGKLGCIASNETIGQETGLTKGTVAKCMSQLNAGGWVKVTLNKGKRVSITPLLEIQPPLPAGKPPFTPESTPLYPQVNIDNILDNSIGNNKEHTYSNGEVGNLFIDFWKEYPNRRIERQKCEKIFSLLTIEVATFIISNVIERKTSVEWTKESGQYVPNTYKYLKNKRWEDEIIKKEVFYFDGRTK